MKKTAETIRSTRFKQFVACRRRWFIGVFLLSLPGSFFWLAHGAHSMATALVFALPLALVITTFVSLLSAPMIWMVTSDKQTGTANKTNGH